jgi:Protein tyrosine and serine/threonine kinase
MWELCTLQKAYAGMSKQEHLELVVGSQMRPKLSAVEGSSVIKKLIQSCWNHAPDKRPAFSDIRKILCSELDLQEVLNGSSKNNRFMRLRKQRQVSSGSKSTRSLTSVFQGNMQF